MGTKTKWELLCQVWKRYREAKGRKDGAAMAVMLDEFCGNTGYHRKYAIRLLNGPLPEERVRKRRPRGVSYSREALQVLEEVWAAANYPWSVRLKALLPLWMPWIRKRFRLREESEKELLSISARQMDRRLRAKKRQARKRFYGRTKPGYLLKHQIAVRTERWETQEPGFVEADLVSHSGNAASGEFAHSLTLTDIASTWTESCALLGKSEIAALGAVRTIAGALPFALRGVDTDNGSEFINHHMKRWCDAEEIQFTRGRPYKKDDNAHIEQKNWTHVRKLLAWDRYDRPEAVEAINDLYRHELRLWMNLFQPSVKLLRKQRVGSKTRRVYSAALTPLDRLRECPGADAQKVAELERLRRQLDPLALSRAIDRKLERIARLANHRRSPRAGRTPPVAMLQNLSGGGKDAAWKTKTRFSTPLGNPAKAAGFPLSHRRNNNRGVTFPNVSTTPTGLHSHMA